MKKQNNSYARKAKKKGFLGGITETQETKGDLKNTAIETGKDLVVGVIGGGAAGAALGRYSLVAGLLVTGLGHYFDNRMTTALGLGMMASGTFAAASGMGNTDNENKTVLEGVKERLQLFKDGLAQKFFIDKLRNSNQANLAIAASTPVGDVQYFSYPETTGELGANDVAMHVNALDNLEKQIAESGQQMKGFEENLLGEGDELFQIGEMGDAQEGISDIGDIGDTGEIDFSQKNY